MEKIIVSGGWRLPSEELIEAGRRYSKSLETSKEFWIYANPWEFKKLFEFFEIQESTEVLDFIESLWILENLEKFRKFWKFLIFLKIKKIML